MTYDWTRVPELFSAVIGWRGDARRLRVIEKMFFLYVVGLLCNAVVGLLCNAVVGKFSGL